MRILYAAAAPDAGQYKTSLQKVLDTIADNAGSFGSAGSASEMGSLRMMRELVDGTVSGKRYSAAEAASMFGMDISQVRSLYLLYRYQNGQTDSWEMPMQTFQESLSGYLSMNPMLSGELGETMTRTIRAGAGLAGLLLRGDTCTPEELAETLEGLSPELNRETILLLYKKMELDEHPGDPGRHTLRETAALLADGIGAPEGAAVLFGDDSAAAGRRLQQLLEKREEQLGGETAGRLIVITDGTRENLEGSVKELCAHAFRQYRIESGNKR